MPPYRRFGQILLLSRKFGAAGYRFMNSSIPQEKNPEGILSRNYCLTVKQTTEIDSANQCLGSVLL